MRRYVLLAPFLFLLSLAGIAGCPGELTDLDRFDTCDVENRLFPETCSKVGCHNTATHAGDLDLEAPGVRGRLVGQQASAACAGLLVDLDDPEASILYKKLTDDFCGPARMPLVGTPLSDAQLTCVLDWIISLKSDGGTDGGP